MLERTTSGMIRVTIGDLARLPSDKLARLLMECAAGDPSLLSRLHATLSEQTSRSATGRGTGQAQIVGQSAAMRHVETMIARFARTDEPVLITGESGTGKELAARAIHEQSGRSGGPFVAVNCAAIPSNLVASELFGYEKGAFTGAAARTKGQIEHASGGTLFLDEIGDMPVDLQGHLLRFLQEGQIVRVGGRETIPVNVRVVSATNVRLRQAMAEGRFREDLYYRLNVLTLQIPALRQRPEDIELLAWHFLQLASEQYGRDVTGFEPAALDMLRNHAWPGNVRELGSTIRRAVVVGDGPVLRAADLADFHEAPGASFAAQVSINRPMPGSHEERSTLLRALACTQENVTLTAQELGVSRVTLYRMLRRHSINLSRGFKPMPAMN